MENKYLVPLMKQFITSIEEIEDSHLKNNKIISIYNTIFEISKTDVQGFIDGFHIMKTTYDIPKEILNKKSSELIIASFNNVKENYILISENETYLSKYSEIIQLMELNSFTTQEYILRSLFEDNSLHPIILKTFIKKFENINWESIFFSQSCYLNFLDNILDYWKINPKSLNNISKDDPYSLAIDFFNLLLQKTLSFKNENTAFYKKEILSVFTKLQEKFPNYYWNFSDILNINLLSCTLEKIGFLEKYFFDAPKKFSNELKEIEHNDNILNFLDIIIYKNSFPYTQQLKDENIEEHYESHQIFFYLTIALELKNFIYNKDTFLDETYEALRIQEIMLKSHKPALYHYFFNKRLNYQVSQLSLAFDNENTNKTKGIFKI